MKLTVNQANTLRLMHATFSSGFTFLTEAMQNARRAGATEIRFMTDEVTNGLTIEDNGTGVGNFADLLTVAQSGWDETIQTAERPFGVGFLSVLLAGTGGVVESGTTRMEWDSEALMAGEEATFTEIPAVKGTKVELKLVQKLNGNTEYHIDKCLTKAAKGFPIEVTLNGSYVGRRFAKDNLRHATHIEGIGTLGLTADYASTWEEQLFFQGLPITPSNDDAALPSRFVLHLEGDFEVRMPDRDRLIDLSAKELIRKLYEVDAFNRVLLTALERREGLLRQWEWDAFACVECCRATLKQLDAIPVSRFNLPVREVGDSFAHSYWRGGGCYTGVEAFSWDKLDIDRDPALSRDHIYAEDLAQLIFANSLPRFTEDSEGLAVAALSQLRSDGTVVIAPSSGSSRHAFPDWLANQAVEIEYLDLKVEALDGDKAVDCQIGYNTARVVTNCSTLRVELKVTKADDTEDMLTVEVDNLGWHDGTTVFLTDDEVSDKIFMQDTSEGGSGDYYSDEASEADFDYVEGLAKEATARLRAVKTGKLVSDDMEYLTQQLKAHLPRQLLRTYGGASYTFTIDAKGELVGVVKQ